MELFRSLLLIERKRLKGESLEEYEKSKNRVALVLEEYEDEILVATFTNSKEGLNENNYFIRAGHKIEEDLIFENMIYLIPKTSVKGETIFKFSFKYMNNFISRLRVDNLKEMTTEDYNALRKVFKFYNKRLINPDNVIFVFDECIYKVYYVDSKEEDYFNVYPLEYDPLVGMSLKSFEKESLSYEIFLLDQIDFKEQSTRIRNVLEEKKLKLVSGVGLK